MKFPIEFRGSPERTIGMELEFQLVDAGALDLTDGIEALMERLGETPFVLPEFIQSAVEVVSETCRSVPELAEDLGGRLAEVHAAAGELGMALCGLGTHPFCTRLASITPTKRYLSIARQAGYVSRTLITYSIHVHVGLPSGEEMVKVMNRLAPYLPILLAMSANSPFWQGLETSYASYRQRILAGVKSYGPAPPFESWKELIHFFSAAHRARIYRNFRGPHWDMRPRPDFGTLEVRVMDAQPTLVDAIRRAALVQSLVEYLRVEPGPLAPQPAWVEHENRHRASHHGLEARYVLDSKGDNLPMREIAMRVLNSVAPKARELGILRYLEDLRESIEDSSGYDLQRRVFEEDGSFEAVVARAVARLNEEVWSSSENPMVAS